MLSGKPTILVVEDTPTQAELARAMLANLGYGVSLASSVAAAHEIVLRDPPDAILLDIELPDGSGLQLLRELRRAGLAIPVVVVTANSSVNIAVEAMREGASDFVMKPFARARLSVTLGNLLEKQALAAELRNVRRSSVRDRFFSFIGASPPMRAVYQAIESVASSRASVFVTGESGTGKELAAEAIHKASPRAARPFIALNCGAIPRDLLESAIFGHTKGAFTGATADREGAAKAADGGTLFLDEIGEMPLEMQVKLLRFVQTGSFQAVGASRTERVDVRFVSATNRDPAAEVAAGRFREDLFYRLYVVPIELPPLRDRGDDVVLIARHFLETFAREDRKRFRGFSAEAERALGDYPWPGNVRQLQNVMQQIVVMNDAETVELAMLPAVLLRGRTARPDGAADPYAEPAGAIAPAMETAGGPPVSAPPLPAGTRGAPLATAVIERAPARIDAQWLPAPGTTDPGGVYPMADPPPRRGVGALPPPAGDPVSPVAQLAAAAGGQAVAVEEILPLAEVEKRAILGALAHTQNDVPRAAALLRVNPSTIYRKLQAWRAHDEGA